jgi:Transcriptional regulators
VAKMLDELDLNILKKLKENSLKPFVKIARELNVSEGTIRQRIKKLVKSGVIKRFTVDVDASSAGLPLVAFVILNVEPDSLKSVAEEVGKIENVVEVHEIHTFGDLLLKVRVKSLKELGELVAQKIRSIKSVSVQYVIPVLNVWKDSPL